MAETTYLREYETIYILRPEIGDDVVDKLNLRVREVANRGSARVLRHELWGKKKLAYEVKKNQKGIFVFMQYLADQKFVSEFERNLRMWDDVIKYQTIRLDEEVNAEVRVTELPPPSDLPVRVVTQSAPVREPLPEYDFSE